MAGIGVVFNPRSRKNRKTSDAAARLKNAVGGVGVVREALSLEELTCVAREFFRMEIDVLAISGGDGTNHITLTEFLRVYEDHPLPALAFLRGGTMNIAANSFGVRHGKPEALLRKLATRYSERGLAHFTRIERRLVRVGDHVGFVFGVGVVHNFLKELYRREEKSQLAAAETLAAAIASTAVQGPLIRAMARPFRGSVTFDDHTRWPERDYLAIAGGSIDQIGLNFRPFYRSTEKRDAFHILGIYASPKEFILELPRIWKGVRMRPDRSYEAVRSSAVIHSMDGTMRYMIDGDLHERDGELRIAIGPSVEILRI